MKCYLASGWWSELQEAARQVILTELKKAKIDVYSPKDDGLFKEGMDPEEIFQENLKQINQCDFIIASTEGKDMGTLFEAGYAYAVKKPIVYFWHNGYGKFNLMLSQSAHAVTTSSGGLFEILKRIKSSGIVPVITYKGDIE
jgi:nucleoside 2-deoxyribosyltransferase